MNISLNVYLNILFSELLKMQNIITMYLSILYFINQLIKAIRSFLLLCKYFKLIVIIRALNCFARILIYLPNSFIKHFIQNDCNTLIKYWHDCDTNITFYRLASSVKKWFDDK